MLGRVECAVGVQRAPSRQGSGAKINVHLPKPNNSLRLNPVCIATTYRDRSEGTKPTELRFRALLTEGDARVHFHREGFGQLKDDFS